MSPVPKQPLLLVPHDHAVPFLSKAKPKPIPMHKSTSFELKLILLGTKNSPNVQVPHSQRSPLDVIHPECWPADTFTTFLSDKLGILINTDELSLLPTPN